MRPSRTFLSWRMCAQQRVRREGPRVGDLAERDRQPDRCEMAAHAVAPPRPGTRPSRAERSKASRMPSATASPCSSASPNPVSASSAWPKVWPKLSSARSPSSRSSAATTAALAAQLLSTAPRRASPHRPSTSAGAVRLEPFEEGAVADEAVFHHLGIARQQLAPRQASRACRCRPAPAPAGGRRRPGSCRASCRSRSCRRPSCRPAPAAWSASARSRGRAAGSPRRSR